MLISNSNFSIGVGSQWIVHDVVSGANHDSDSAAGDSSQYPPDVSGDKKRAIDAAVLAIAQHPSIKSKDSLVPDWKSPGWKSDANKNLPGLKKLYETFPQSDWYMMIDDDTYVFLDNLMDHLNSLDPNEPIYTGRATSFVGCDGVIEHGDGPAFGHGGSGYILSRAAMRKLMSKFTHLNKKYSSCWAGDIRVALR
ncbi:hypothetical protein HDU98_010564 [Podochytrium sp. JEL0797]|nr:hypothetical protein HDU98_010564 [Podochytrium sp. JEL0797]